MDEKYMVLRVAHFHLFRPFICTSMKTVQSSNADGAKEQIGSFTGKYVGYVQEASGKNTTVLLKLILI